MRATIVKMAAGAAGVLAMGALVLPLPTATAGGREGPQRCDNADLSASYHSGGAAMSHQYGRIILRNVSSDMCLITGYGGLSYVGGGDGTQVGAAADRTPGSTPTIFLQPGRKVVSRVAETSYAPYPKRKCHPTPVDGFRVYVPDSTESQFIAHPTTGCRGQRVHLLEHRAYHRP